MTNMYLDGDDEDYEDVGGKTTFHSINSKLEAILDVMQPSVTTGQLKVEQAPPAPEPADETIKAKRPRAKALKKKDSMLNVEEDAPPPADEPVDTADVLAETTDVGGALGFHPLVVGNAGKQTFSVFELEGEPIHEEQVLDEQGPRPPPFDEGPNHTVAPHAIVEEQIMDEMGPPSGHGKDSGENDSAATVEEAEDEEEPVFESLRDYHSSLRRDSDDGAVHVGHLHTKFSREKNAENPEMLPERWIPPEESDPGTEMAPRAPDEEDDEGKIECRSTGGAFGAKSGGVVIRYQYEMRHLAGPSVDDILPKLEGGITDRLLPIFFGEECREINVNDLMYEGFTERRQLEIGGLRGSGAGRALAEEIGSALETSNLRGHRRLSRVIGIDSTPKDSPIFGKDCQFQLPNIDSRCHVMEGALTLHFPPNYSVEQLVQGAHLSALNKLRESMADGTLALSHPALMDLNFLPSSYTLRPIVDSAFSGLNVGTASVKSAKPVPVGAIVGVIIPLLLLCCCGGCVFACWRKNGKSFAVPGVEINVKSRRDMDDGSDADDELEKPRNRKDKKKKKRKKKRSGSRSDGSTTDNDESTKGSLDEFDELAEGMNAARAVGDDEKQSLLDKKSKKKKKKKDKKKKKKKKNNDDTDGTTTDEDTDTADEGTTDEDLGESATSLNSLEKFERLQARRGRRTTLHGSDPNIAKLHSSTSFGRDSPGNLRAELSRNRRASFAGHRPADIAGLRRNSLRSSSSSRSFHMGSDHNGSFHSQGSSFHSRESRRTSEGSDSDNMSTTSHTSTESSDGSRTSTTSSDGSHTRETNGTTTSSSDEGTTTSSDGSTTSSGSSDEEKEELEKRVMSTFLHHRKGVKQQMRQQGGKKKKVSKPNTRTKKNNNVMMGHVDTGDDDCSVMTGVSCATEVVGNKSKPQFGRGFKPPQDDDDVSCATEAVSNRAGAGFRRPQFGGGFKPPVQDDDDVSCATEAVSNKGGAFRRPQFGGGFKPPVPVQEDDDDDCSVFSAMTEATEMVQNKPAVTRKPWRPAGYRAPSSKKDNDDVSVNSGFSAATEAISNKKKGGRASGFSSNSSTISSNSNDDVSVMSEATEMVSNTRGTRQGSFHGLQGISEGDSDEES